MKSVPWRAAVVGLALWSLATPGTVAAETSAGPVAGEMQLLITGEQVPLSARAIALFHLLASLERDPERAPDGFLLAAGLDPTSKSARSLVNLALEVTERFPLEIPEETVQRFSVTGDGAGFLAWQHRRNLERSEAVGAALGAWLERRREDGYAIGPLTDRLLRSPLLRIEIGGDGTAADRLRNLDHEATRFELGLATELSTLPKPLRRMETER